jgi:hypothetical protein
MANASFPTFALGSSGPSPGKNSTAILGHGLGQPPALHWYWRTQVQIQVKHALRMRGNFHCELAVWNSGPIPGTLKHPLRMRGRCLGSYLPIWHWGTQVQVQVNHNLRS